MATGLGVARKGGLRVHQETAASATVKDVITDFVKEVKASCDRTAASIFGETGEMCVFAMPQRVPEVSRPHGIARFLHQVLPNLCKRRSTRQAFTGAMILSSRFGHDTSGTRLAHLIGDGALPDDAAPG